jgi:hypothetical protein
MLEQQLLALKHKNDPEWEWNQFNKLFGGNETANQGTSAPGDQYPDLHKMFSGQGMFPSNEQANEDIPENVDLSGGQGIYSSPIVPNNEAQLIHEQQAASVGARPGQHLLDVLRADPIKRAYFKHKYKFDPLAVEKQTPEEKNADALNLFKQKENIKAASKSGDTATDKILTQNQQAVQAIDTVIPMIDELINNPDKIYGPFDYSPSKRAAYNAKTGGMIDMLVAAQSLPQVKESVNLVEDQIRRGTGESKAAYKERLKDFKKDLLARKNKSVKVVNSKKVDTTSVIPEETKTIDGVKYEKINGEWYVSN